MVRIGLPLSSTAPSSENLPDARFWPAGFSFILSTNSMMDVLALEAIPSSASFMLAGVASFLPLVAVSNSTPVSFRLGISPCACIKINAGLTPLLSMTLIVSTSCATVSNITRLS